MTQRSSLLCGAIMACLAVAIGAFGAHGLKDILMQHQRTETFELAVRYQFYHAFALLVSGMLMNYYSASKLRIASLLFVAGIILFSGSLYVLSLTGFTKLGAITPLGGLCFIAGWILVAWSLSKTKASG